MLSCLCLLRPAHTALNQTWALLYGVMGYASYLVGKSAGWGSRPMVLYGAQLALNLAWQPLFFLAKKPGVAQIDNAGAAVAGSCWTDRGCVESDMHGMVESLRSPQLCLDHDCTTQHVGAR